MKATFKKAYRFSENGFSFIDFEAGHEYEVSQSCADSARQSGCLDTQEESPDVDGGKEKESGDGGSDDDADAHDEDK